MKPFGPVYFYYDFADTEGKYVPRDIKSLNEFHFPERQPVAEKFLPVLQEACRYLSISYYEKAFGTKQLGEAGSKNGCGTVFVAMIIVVAIIAVASTLGIEIPLKMFSKDNHPKTYQNMHYLAPSICAR